MLSMLLSKTKSFFKITVTSLQNTRDMNNIGALTDVQPKKNKKWVISWIWNMVSFLVRRKTTFPQFVPTKIGMSYFKVP